MKVSHDFLGDVLDEGGIEKSTEATVKSRYGRTIATILEISAFLHDFRIDSLGGVKSGLMIYEMAILPSLLHNSSTWFNINNKTIKSLENLQTKMFSVLFASPDSAPRPLLCFDLGSLSILERIHEKKLNFLFFLTTLTEENLSANIYKLQVKYNFPGLATEARELINLYKLPNIIDDTSLKFTKKKWKILVNNAIRKRSEENLKHQFLKYSKLKAEEFQNEDFCMKKYVNEMSLRDARTNFRLRSSTLPLKMNMKSDPGFAEVLWRCDSCFSAGSSLCPETNTHVLWCPTYAPFREGLSLNNDNDIVKYFQKVLEFKTNLEKQN